MEKHTIGKKLSAMLDVPEESVMSAPRITISGGGRVLVEGHRGLVAYAEDCVTAAGPGCRILIKGEKLGLVAMNRREMVVSGRLWAVELE